MPRAGAGRKVPQGPPPPGARPGKVESPSLASPTHELHLAPGAACPVCGAAGSVEHRVLWPGLVAAWGLSSEEEAYVNRQQGCLCSGCGANMRSAALALALCRHLGWPGTLDGLLRAPPGLAMLEINEAGTLHPRLARFPGHRLGRYPECDMMRLADPDGSLDVVIHSDTLEHVADPMAALRETRRALRPGGAAVFTVPTIVGRLTRTRRGLPASYHGAEGVSAPDLLVHTEFGADAWCMVLEAGFSECRITPYGYPAGLAFTAVK